MKVINFCTIIGLGLLSLKAVAQSPINGFMQGKGKGNIVVSYNAESYKDVYLVPKKVNGVPVFNKVKLNSASLFATIGLSKKVDVQFNLPYIKATGNASSGVLNNLGYANEKKGLQDVSIYVKYNPYFKKMGKGSLTLITALGLQAPMGSYKVDESLQSIIAIGNRATQISGIALLQYKNDNGFFVSGSTGYSIKNNDVPNAMTGEIKVGYAVKKYYVDAYIAGQNSGKGTDILKEGFDAVFPKTRVSYSKIGLNAYVPIKKGFGVAAGFSSIVAGRNIGASSGGYGAVIYSF
jgi:hypothetical protein